jgi:hypothetical protein
MPLVALFCIIFVTVFGIAGGGALVGGQHAKSVATKAGTLKFQAKDSADCNKILAAFGEAARRLHFDIDKSEMRCERMSNGKYIAILEHLNKSDSAVVAGRHVANHFKKELQSDPLKLTTESSVGTLSASAAKAQAEDASWSALDW